MLQIDLLGEVKITWHPTGVLVPRLHSRKSVVVLAYLAMASNRMHAREVLCEALWPGQPMQNQRAHLRYELTLLRNTLGPTVIHAQGHHWVGLSSEVQCDTVSFEALASQSLLEMDIEQRITSVKSALDLYRGEFLPGFFDDWVAEQRQRLDDTYNLLLHCFVTDLKATERLDAATLWESKR
jgi:DNA-binding SARP family transcriptional activator